MGEEGPAEAYSDMTFSVVDNHQELGFPVHEDKNVTCQSKAEQSGEQGLRLRGAVVGPFGSGGAQTGLLSSFNCPFFVSRVSTPRFLMSTVNLEREQVVQNLFFLFKLGF